MIQPLDDNSSETSREFSRQHHRSANYTPIFYLVLLGVIVVLVVILVFKPGNISLPKWPLLQSSSVSVDSDYQAVFLSNNQIYFGKIANLNSQFPVLSDVFYLQVSQNIQPGQAGNQNVKVEKGKEGQSAAVVPQNELTLIKLGAEVHGPTDQIQINRDHIIFIENLKNDSKVVAAIQQYKQRNPAPVKF